MKQLNEINILRPIIIVLLVLYHSFIIYTNGWPKVEGIEECVIYYWIAKLSYASMLETFTFISGYLFAYAIYNGKKYSFRSLTIKKIKRLIIPCIVFTIIYSFLFYEKSYFSLGYVYDILNGLGHMWYLPMLFWCFLAAYLILNIKIKESYKLILLLLLAVFSLVPLPLRMHSSCYYLFFFYLGIYIYNKKLNLELKCKKILMGGAFFFAFILIQIQIYDMNVTGYVETLIKFALINFTKICYALVGLFFLYSLSIKLSKNSRQPHILKDINKLCFGIYLIQQFVLKILYYETSLPLLCGTYLLPWVGFIIALVSSTLLALILKKTRLGNSLI